MSVNFGIATAPKPDDWVVMVHPGWTINEGIIGNTRAVYSGSTWKDHPIVLMLPSWWDEGMIAVSVAKFNQAARTGRMQ